MQYTDVHILSAFLLSPSSSSPCTISHSFLLCLGGLNTVEEDGLAEKPKDTIANTLLTHRYLNVPSCLSVFP